jgi:hypothetical protein
MSKLLLYFGCVREAGHHLWANESRSMRPEQIAAQYDINPNLLRNLDATFPPGHAQHECIYNTCVIHPIRIIAWWDRSLDKRPGSNSALIGIGYNSADDMFIDAETQFPSVMKRQNMKLRSICIPL